jgi:hypothetical protein
MEKFMLELNIRFDGEVHWYYNGILFYVFYLPNMIWFDYVFNSL